MHWHMGSESGLFRSGPPLPGPRSDFALAVTPRKVVLVGGCTVPRHPVADTWIYERDTGRWRVGAPIPTPREGMAWVQTDGRLITLGGFTSDVRTTEVVEAFDLEEETWETLEPLPSSRSWSRAAYEDGQLHVVGGWYLDQQGREEPRPEHFVRSLLSGDLATWREEPSLPNPGCDGSLTCVEDMLYWVTGARRLGFPKEGYLYTTEISDELWGYDRWQGVWQRLPTL